MGDQANQYPQVAEYIASVPWLIEDGYLDMIKSRVDGSLTIEQVAQNKELAEQLRQEREHSPAAVAARAGTRIEKTRRATMREGGVAILPITGPIFRFANLFTAYSGATSTQMLSTDFQALMDNSDVRAILISIDSPGGEAFGIGELASMIHLGAQQKPVAAYVSGMGASAAYWLASAAGEIVADSIAILGSIGVVLTVRSMKRAERQRGIDSYEIVSTQSPRKRLEPESDEGRQALQETADAMAEVFVESVARNRGVSVETVLAEFGQGGVMVGKRAVGAGLADRIGSFESLLAELAGGNARKPRAGIGAKTQPATGANSGGTMSKEKGFFARLFASLSDEEKQEAAADIIGVQQAASKAATQTPAPPAAAQESEEVKKLRAENEKLRTDALEQRKATLKAEAEGFINAKIVAAEVLPAVKDGFVEAYVQAGLDDDAHPRAQGEKSRVDMLKAQYQGKGKHGLTEEQTSARVPTGAKVIADSDDEDAELKADKKSAEEYAARATGNKPKA
jgi:signal peptide peptidase SppA